MFEGVNPPYSIEKRARPLSVYDISLLRTFNVHTVPVAKITGFFNRVDICKW
jgi:hypothetical protein